MSPDEVIGMAIFFGSIVSIIFIITVGSIIKTWMKKGSSKNLSENREFLDALRDFKENMDRRVSNLEEIVAEKKDHAGSLNPTSKKKNSQRAIEIELEDETNSKEKNGESEKLRNMLTQ